MRDLDEQQIALACLNLAYGREGSTEDIISRAAVYYAFVSAQKVDAIQTFLDSYK